MAGTGWKDSRRDSTEGTVVDMVGKVGNVGEVGRVEGGASLGAWWPGTILGQKDLVCSANQEGSVAQQVSKLNYGLQ